MTNSVEQIKQKVLRESSIQEIEQTLLTFKSLEKSLNHLLDVELAQLDTQYAHLADLSDIVSDSEFKRKLRQFGSNRLKARKQHLKTMLLMSRQSIVNARVTLADLASRQKELNEE